jgi:uncharacterized membrane protein
LATEEDFFMPFCNTCGAQIPDGATTCAACASRAAAAGSVATAGGLTDNVAGMLAYVTIIPAIIFLVMEPYNRNRFVRFHSFQCLFFFVALLVLQIGVSILSIVPLMGLLMLPLHFLIAAGAFVLWIVLLLKANAGQMYKLPVIGDMAAQQANAI